MLFHVRGEVNIEASMVSNIIPATPSKGMQVTMNQNRAMRAGSFIDLLRMTFDQAKGTDFMNLRLSQISIKVVPKMLASHMLQGNFATEKVTSLDHEADKVEPSALLPQKNKCLVERKATANTQAATESVMDIIDSHKTTSKTAITHIGTMHDISDFSSLWIM